jgi:AcrR family transcriptional regulator
MARLCADGVESVRVELLARDLRVSKGSFYWHFHDREELLGKMLSQWEADDRSRLGSKKNQTAAQRWASFVEQSSAAAEVRLELALRSWAHRDSNVAAVLARADEEKHRFIAGVLGEIGFEPSRAASWAEIVLLVWLGWLERAANAKGSESGSSSLNDILSVVILAASGQRAT